MSRVFIQIPHGGITSGKSPFMNLIEQYFRYLREIHNSGSAVKETFHYDMFSNFPNIAVDKFGATLFCYNVRRQF
jgi:hypothetical protein